MLFEFLHLMAEGALGHRQFGGSLDKTQMPGHGFKGAQGQEWGKVLVQCHVERSV